MNSTMVTVKGIICINTASVSILYSVLIIHVAAPPISVIVIANLSTPLVVGQTGNTLTCDVTGAERLKTITLNVTIRIQGELVISMNVR